MESYPCKWALRFPCQWALFWDEDGPTFLSAIIMHNCQQIIILLISLVCTSVIYSISIFVV